jgi:hypothetical protein
MLKRILAWFKHTPVPSGVVLDLSQEVDFYRRNVGKFDLPDERKKFVLVKGAEVAGYFESFEEAAAEGYRRFKHERFLVEPAEKEPVTIARCVDPIPWAS